MADDSAALEPQPNGDDRRRSRRDAIILIVTGGVFLVFLVLETLLPQISDSSSLSGNIIFFLLINLNLILLGLLVYLVTRSLVRLVLDRRRNIFGAQLRTRLVLSFIGFALVPSAFLFFAAQIFLNSAFETWFDVRIEGSLKDSMEVTQSYYQFAADNGVHFARQVADQVARDRMLQGDDHELVRYVESKRREWNVETIEIVGRDHKTRARSDSERVTEEPVRRSQHDLEQVLAGETTTDTIRYGKADIVSVGTPVQNEAGETVAAVLVHYLVPRNVSRKARAAGRSYEEYRRIVGMRQPIENQYILTLALITLVLIFSASWVGFQQAKRITIPLQRLEEGTREVAQGNWSYRIEAVADYETGVLVDSFNQMTADLQKINAELIERRKYVESILGNITAGVVSFDEEGHVTTLNPAAEAMLGVRRKQVRGKHWSIAFDRPDLRGIADLLEQVAASPRREAEQQVRLSAGDQSITALASATALFDDDYQQRGTILFLENVTHLLRVQRMEAWREVARRMAHEIKNPLTPIQLSAQRLRKRYADLLSQPDGVLLEECTRSIISQVEALKRLVSEFSTFARLPAVELAPHDLNAVIEESVALFREGHPEITFDLRCDPHLPLVEIDRDAMKRALVNMLDNAVAACEAAHASPAHIEVVTQIDPDRDALRLEVADNGTGMRPEVKQRLFEPYFSTKRDGTGLGLAIVASIVSDHRAYIRVQDNQPSGSRFVISFPLRRRPPMVQSASA